VLLAPTIRALFSTELPDTRCVYVLHSDDDVDPSAVRRQSFCLGQI
jgi:hypothetical protein